jgi:hypothetical protein
VSTSIEITVNGVDQAVEMLLRYDERARLRVDSAQRETAQKVAARARALAPVFDGHLKASIRAYGTEAVAGADYAAAVEYGAAPHMPPVSAVTAWALAHGMRPWALALAIKRRGTPAQPYMRPAAESERPGYILRVDEALREAEL